MLESGVAPTLLQVESISESTRLLLNGYEVLGAILGLFIAYLAYRGYVRNDSRPMLFIAIGFALILGLPLLLFVPRLVGVQVNAAVLQAIVQTFEIAGLVSIIYALRIES